MRTAPRTRFSRSAVTGIDFGSRCCPAFNANVLHLAWTCVFFAVCGWLSMATSAPILFSESLFSLCRSSFLFLLCSGWTEGHWRRADHWVGVSGFLYSLPPGIRNPWQWRAWVNLTASLPGLFFFNFTHTVYHAKHTDDEYNVHGYQRPEEPKCAPLWASKDIAHENYEMTDRSTYKITMHQQFYRPKKQPICERLAKCSCHFLRLLLVLDHCAPSYLLSADLFNSFWNEWHFTNQRKVSLLGCIYTKGLNSNFLNHF